MFNALMTILVLSACGGGSGGELPNSDTIPPEVVKTEPASGALISVNNFLRITFNEVIQLPESINIDVYQYNDDGSLNKIVAIPLTSNEPPISLDNTGTELIIRTLADNINNKPFKLAKKYQVNLRGIKDAANNSMSSVCRFEFATEGYSGQLVKGLGLCDSRESSQPPTTSASILSGVYNTEQLIELTCLDIDNKSCNKIYYTTDGSEPTSSSEVYLKAISINAINELTVLKYYGIDSLGIIEPVKLQRYRFDLISPTTTAIPLGSNYNTIQTVELRCTDFGGATCYKTYYTLDGSFPSQSSIEYLGAISIPSTTTLRYLSEDSVGNLESPKIQEYLITTSLPVTTASPVSGIFSGEINVALTCSVSGGSRCLNIYYSVDGTTPTINSSVYVSPINITNSNSLTKLQYFSTDIAGNIETIKTQIYELDSLPPKTTSNLNTGFYNKTLSILLSCIDASSKGCAKTYYAINGVVTSTSPLYSANVPINITTMNAETTLNYFSIDNAGNVENINTQTYILDNIAPITSASEIAGSYQAPITVALSCAEITPGSGCKNIYYTTDGSTPAINSTTTNLYDGNSININETSLLRYFSTDNANNNDKTSDNAQYYIISTTANGASSGPTGSSIKSITVEPKSNGRIYSLSSAGDKLYETTVLNNNIVSVQTLLSGKSGLNSIAVEPNIPDVIYVSSDDGLYRTKTGGSNWELISTIPSEFTFSTGASIYFISKSANFVFTGGTVYKSEDSGLTFFSGAVRRTNSLMIPGGGSVYALTDGYGIFENFEFGSNIWDYVIQSQQKAGWFDDDVIYQASDDFGFYILTEVGIYKGQPGGYFFVVTPTVKFDRDNKIAFNGDVYYSDGATLFKSIDNGVTWTNKTFSNSIITGSITNIIVDQADTKIIYLEFFGGYTFRTIDSGVTWLPWDNGLNAANILSLGQYSNTQQSLIAAVYGKGIYKIDQTGVVWSGFGNYNKDIGEIEAITAINISPHLNLNNTNTVFVSSKYKAGIDLSTDDGVTWINIKFSTFSSTAYSDKVVFDSKQPDIMYASIYDNSSLALIAKSNDQGLTWINSSIGITGIRGNSLTIDPINTNNLYVYDSTEVFKSDNGALSWNNLNVGNLGIISSLVINQNKFNILHLSTDTGFYTSIDGGLNWSTISNKFYSFHIMSVSPFNDNIIYAASLSGFYRSTNAGKDWSPVIINNMPSVLVKSIRVDSINDNIIYVGTNNSGVWTIAFSP